MRQYVIVGRMNKKVAIFSVGRSGSKALQLYVSCGLAKKFGKVWVNYEPFRYIKKCLDVSPYGKYLDRRLPKLISHLDEREEAHLDNFVRGLDSEHATVSKFIRAGGRDRLCTGSMSMSFSSSFETYTGSSNRLPEGCGISRRTGIGCAVRREDSIHPSSHSWNQVPISCSGLPSTGT